MAGVSANVAEASYPESRLCRALVLICLALLATGSMRAPAAPADMSDTATPVRRSEYLTVEGAKLFLLTRGADRRLPVLLWLHGGPGGAERPLFRYYSGELENHFVVAYWDQRGAGRSFDPEADPGNLTVARHLADLDVIVDHLRSTFGQDRIVLLGHSWGGMLGILYAQRHPEKVAALIAVAPLVSPRESQQQQYKFVVTEATRNHDETTLTRLREIGPPPYRKASRVLAVDALADRYGAVYHRKPNRWRVLVAGVLRGLVTPWEIPRLIHANDVSLDAMTPELLTLDLRQTVPSVRVPVFFFLGRYDHHIGSAIAARYFESLQAAYKRLIWFEHSAHNVPFEEPARFDDTVTRELGEIGIEACRFGCRKRVLPGSADGSHRATVTASAEEPITAVRLQPRYAHARRHFQRLQNLACSGVDSPQLALVAFPGAVPEFAVDPSDTGDKAVGFDRAENFPGPGVDLMDLAVAILSHPERTFRPREP